MPEYQARHNEYKTIQNDMWDIVALRQYRDEHAMHAIQDANFEQRFTDAFPAGVILAIPKNVSIRYNLKSGTPIPPLEQLLPWR
jgi:phage tail protein X